MDQEEKLFDKIENFLKGSLSPAEQSAFEKEIATDSELAEMVDLHRFELDGAEYLVEKDLRAKMKSWETEKPHKPQANKSIPINWKLFLGIAAILALITFTILKLMSPEPDKGIRPQMEKEIPSSVPKSAPIPEDKEKAVPPVKEIATAPTEPTNKETPKKIEPPVKPQKNYLAMAQTNYQLPESLSDITTRKADGSTEASPLDKAFQLFDDKKWNLAISEFSKIDATKNPDEFEVAQEYLGHAYFNARDYQSAAAIFRAIYDQEFIIGQEETEWYLLLSLLANYKENKTAIDILVNEIIQKETPHEYLDKVKALGL